LKQQVIVRNRQHHKEENMATSLTKSPEGLSVLADIAMTTLKCEHQERPASVLIQDSSESSAEESHHSDSNRDGHSLCSEEETRVASIHVKYRDYSKVSDEAALDSLSLTKAIKVVPQENFAVKLHRILERADEDGYSSIISWMPHGRAFKIHNTVLFLKKISYRFFFLTGISSFSRQLGIYGFQKITNKDSIDRGGYFHELFLRGRPGLLRGIIRQKKRCLIDPDSEPDLSIYEPMPSSLHNANNIHFDLLERKTQNEHEKPRPRIVYYENDSMSP